MAIIQTNNNHGSNDPDYSEFLISNVSELANLPTSTTKPRCAISSTALLESATEFKLYILSTGNEWIEFV